MKENLTLRPVRYASVSGGKDSLMMLNVILKNPDKYPLDLVVNFDLEIDWPWAKDVVSFMEDRCKKAGIRFLRIKPRKSFEELYEKYDVPTRKCRWCNSDYKLDCKRQLNEWIRSQNCRPVAYIGFCADEQKRFKYEIGNWKDQDICYPLAEEGICEKEILKWAKDQEIFGNWYRIFERQGCMICPNASRLELAYMLKYYPKTYEDWIDKIMVYEKRFGKKWHGEQSISDIDALVRSKWTEILSTKENFYQMTIFDYM